MVCFFFVVVEFLLHDSTATVPAIGADRTGTATLVHDNALNSSPFRATEMRRMVVLAELDKHQVVLPAGWAVNGDVLSAH